MGHTAVVRHIAGRWGARASILLLALLCAGAARSSKSQYVFYPAPPEAPRLQFLTRLTSAADVGKKQSAFSRFIVGRERTENERIARSYGVAIANGRVYAVDTRRAGYGVFDIAQRDFHFVGGRGGGRFSKPINIAVDTDGTKFITDTGRNQVLVFDDNDDFVRAIGRDGQFKPSGVAVVGDRLYVSDVEHHNIHIVDKKTGKTLRTFGKVGPKNGEFWFPTNVTLGPRNTLYVTDTGNYRVQVFDLDGTYRTSYGSIGTSLGQFARPKGVAVDRDGRAYVVDAAFENVQLFDPTGKLLLFFGQPGGSPEDINMPTGIALDYASAAAFQRYAASGFAIEYVVAVGSQYGPNMVTLYGFGSMKPTRSAR